MATSALQRRRRQPQPQRQRVRANCAAELRAPVHKRAKLAALLLNVALVDLISDATDPVARKVLRDRGLNDDGQPLAVPNNFPFSQKP